jgi:hypothetical protein
MRMTGACMCVANGAIGLLFLWRVSPIENQDMAGIHILANSLHQRGWKGNFLSKFVVWIGLIDITVLGVPRRTPENPGIPVPVLGVVPAHWYKSLHW